MVNAATLGKELAVTVINKIGVLAEVSRILADHGLTIDGISGYSKEDNTAVLLLVVDDILRAGEALSKAGYKAIKENEVVLLDIDNKPGALKNLTAKLAIHDIDIKYLYGTACPSGCPARMVLCTSDNEKALLLFKR